MAFEESDYTCTLVSEQSIFSENRYYKCFLHVAVNLYVSIFWGLDAHGI